MPKFQEVLSKTIIDSEKNQELFNYVWQAYIRLDKLDSLSKSFSLIFLIELCKFLGIYPSDENINFEYFNLNSGEFTKSENVSDKNITGDNLVFFKKIMETANCFNCIRTGYFFILSYFIQRFIILLNCTFKKMRCVQ